MGFNNAVSIALSALFGLFGTSCSSFGQQQGYRIQKNIVFKSVDGNHLTGDLYSPTRSGLKPAVLVIHGGGWDKKSGDMESLSKTLAQAGFVVFNADYRLAPAHLYPDALNDVKDSLKWLKENAANYEIDPNRISGWGYSAGAHLILLVGLDPDQGLKAIVAGGTPADLTAWPESPLVNRFIGHSLKESPDLWKEASPINHVQENSPPVFLYHGEWDHLVEIEQMEKMRQALLKKKRVVKTYTVPWSGHISVYFFSKKSIDLGIAFINEQFKDPTTTSSH